MNDDKASFIMAEYARQPIMIIFFAAWLLLFAIQEINNQRGIVPC